MMVAVAAIIGSASAQEAGVRRNPAPLLSRTMSSVR